MTLGRPTKYREEMCEAVIQSGAEGKTLAEMAEDLDIDRSTLNEWVEKHPEFSRAVKRGLQKAQAWWEQQGRVATFGGVEGYNATSYIFNMKNRFKEDWADISRAELTGKDGGPIKAEATGTEKLSRFLDQIAERSGTAGEPDA